MIYNVSEETLTPLRSARCYRTPITAGKRQIKDLSKFLAAPKTSFTRIPLCAQPSLQMLAGESPVMVKPESHVAYTQC